MMKNQENGGKTKIKREEKLKEIPKQKKHL